MLGLYLAWIFRFFASLTMTKDGGSVTCECDVRSGMPPEQENLLFQALFLAGYVVDEDVLA